MRLATACGKVLVMFGLGIWLSNNVAVAGNLFESDYGSNTIYEFTSGGIQSTFATGFD